MAQYIDKAALVAEIEKLDALYHVSKSLSGELFVEGLFSFINTLEVKEVDLEKEFEGYLDKYNGVWTDTDYIKFAKHFFELGVKAQKGE